MSHRVSISFHLKTFRSKETKIISVYYSDVFCKLENERLNGFFVQFGRRNALFGKLQRNLPAAARTAVTCLRSRLNEFAFVREVEVRFESVKTEIFICSYLLPIVR